MFGLVTLRYVEFGSFKFRWVVLCCFGFGFVTFSSVKLSTSTGWHTSGFKSLTVEWFRFVSFGLVKLGWVQFC